MAKRSCDFCVQRKTKCDGGLPCSKCVEARPSCTCTYLRPMLKRGPKTSRLRRRLEERWVSRGEMPNRGVPDCRMVPPDTDLAPPHNFHSAPGQPRTRNLPASAFVVILEIYRSRMYSVWPVVDATALLAKLEQAEVDDGAGTDAYALATALSAATMAQLNIPSVEHISHVVDSAYMEKECLRVRNSFNYREHASTEGVLASFFLHVYHAKFDNRRAAIMFLQEAISLARLLRLDYYGSELCQSADGSLEERNRKRLLYPLLWVSERGYAAQHGFRVSVQETIKIPLICPNRLDVLGEGLVELGSLFVAFDLLSQHTSPYNSDTAHVFSNKELLLAVCKALTENTPRPINYNSVQRADYHVTKQWMQTLLWQKAMSQGLLSSVSDTELMSFLFPTQIAQSLLASMTTVSEDDLLPLGRDQLFKFFEITNTLADVILCHPSGFISSSSGNYTPSQKSSLSEHIPRSSLRTGECCRYGPTDFLHGLFQTMSPFLDTDERINTLLRQKVAEALLRAPSRVLPRYISEGYDGTERVLEDEEV